MNAIVIIYGGLLEDVELWADKDKAEKRYQEILCEKDLTEDTMSENDYDIHLRADLKIQGISQMTRLLDEALKRVQEFPHKDWDSSRVERLIVNLKKVLK